MADTGDYLRVTQGPAAGQSIHPGDEFVVGRSSTPEGTLGDDPEMSRRHGRFTRTSEGGLRFEDLGSTNGTFVNDRRVGEPQVLHPGDRIRVGTTTLQVVDSSGRAPASTRFAAIPTGPPPGSQTRVGQSSPQPEKAPGASPQPATSPAARERKGPHPALIAAGAVLLLLVLSGAAYALLSGGGGDGGLAAEEQVESSDPDPEQALTNAKKATVRIRGEFAANGLGEGSGVLIDEKENLVLTNSHVVSGASSLEVIKGSQKVSARILGNAPCDDLAVLKLNSQLENVPALPFAEMDAIKEGDPVTALGFPVSSAGDRKIKQKDGTVSAVDLSTEIDPRLPRYSSLVEHEATLNPGNSGGPLVNQQGEVVGINTLGNGQFGGQDLEGQFFSISNEKINEKLEDLKSGKSEADVGWSLDAGTKGEIARDLNIDIDGSSAVYVYDVKAGSNADEAHERGQSSGGPGVRSGDILTQMGGSTVDSVADVCRQLQSAAPGETVSLEVLTAEGRDLFQVPLLMELDKE